jgi:hypothetical protein
LEEVWTHFWLVKSKCENKRGIVLMLVSVLGGCREQKFDDLLNEWLCLVEVPGRGMEWSERQELMLGRSLDSFLVRHKQVWNKDMTLSQRQSPRWEGAGSKSSMIF